MIVAEDLARAVKAKKSSIFLVLTFDIAREVRDPIDAIELLVSEFLMGSTWYVHVLTDLMVKQMAGPFVFPRVILIRSHGRLLFPAVHVQLVSATL